MSNKGCRTIKVPLKKLIDTKKDECIDIYYSILTANQVAHLAHMFLRGYVLYSVGHNHVLTINLEFVRDCFKTVCEHDENGKCCNKQMDKYWHLFSQRTNSKRITTKDVSYILQDAADQLYTQIHTNFKMHYEKYVFKFIKVSFKKIFDSITNINDRKQFTKDMVDIKDYIMGSKNTINNIYLKWANKHRSTMIPSTYTYGSFETDIHEHMYDYMRCGCYMNMYMQLNNESSYHISPLKTQIYPTCIKINTSALLCMFYDHIPENKYKIEYNCQLNSIAGNNELQEEIWNKIFKLKSNNEYIYKLNGYRFNYEMTTDGYTANLNFITHKEFDKKEKKKENRKKARIESIKLKKELTAVEYTKYMQKKHHEQLIKIETDKKLKAEKIKKLQAEFQKKTPEEQIEIKVRKDEKSKYGYVDTLLQKEYHRNKFNHLYNNRKIVVCDPGMRSIMYLMAPNKWNESKNKTVKKNNFGISIWRKRKKPNDSTDIDHTTPVFSEHRNRPHMDDEHTNDANKINNAKRRNRTKKDDSEQQYTERKIMNYTSNTQATLTNRYVYNARRKKWKETHRLANEIKTFENELAKYDSHVCDHDKFLEYVKCRMQYYNTIIHITMDEKVHQKINWAAYLRKREHEKDLVNVIKQEFGKHVRIIMGDWSRGTAPIRFKPTPHASIRRLLTRHFKTYNINEYMTSKTHYESNKICKNVIIPTSAKYREQYEKRLEKRQLYCQAANRLNQNAPNLIDYKTVSSIESLYDIDLIREKPVYTLPSMIKLHAVLAYNKADKNNAGKMSQCCINRDKNSVMNMERIVEHYLKTGKRLDQFKPRPRKPRKKRLPAISPQ